jgi:hypothetical protein
LTPEKTSDNLQTLLNKTATKTMTSLLANLTATTMHPMHAAVACAQAIGRLVASSNPFSYGSNASYPLNGAQSWIKPTN